MTAALLLCATLILGDSVAHGAGDETGRSLAQHLQQFTHGPVLDLAISGSRTWQLAHVVASRRDAIARADTIVISIGGNDLFGDPRARLMSLLAPRLSMDLVLDRLASIIGTIERTSHARIVLLGLYNPYARPKLDEYVSLWSAKLFARFAADRRVQVITIADLFTHTRRLSPTDGFHPNAAAYEAIARRLAEAF
jgi:lysophospholipase L1-like esterase